jgi:transposase
MPDALMPMDLDTLDHAALKAMLLSQHEKYVARQQEYTAALNSRASEIAHLKLLVEKLRRLLFGVKSEKVLLQMEQLELKLEELEADSAVEGKVAQVEQAVPVAAEPFRRSMPEHLPREVHTHMPGHDRCPDCGASCACSAKMLPRCWSMCAPALRSSAMWAPS